MSGSARKAVLSRIRHANGAIGEDKARRAAVAERLSRTPCGVVPARAQLTAEKQVALFVEVAQKAEASVAHVKALGDVPAAVADYLRGRNLPARLRRGEDPRLASMDFGASLLTVEVGPTSGEDLVSLSHADCGVAETGTLVLLSGPENPTSLNFLPEHHLVVIQASEVVGDMEALFPKLRERYGKGVMPRSLNFITGPSRSADIEQTLLLGAHGPKALHVILVG